jgi:CRISPR-associated protein Csm5
MDSRLNIQDSKYKTQNLKIRLHVLSPIHIGCDDVYEPTSFVIDEQRKKLIEFDPIEFIKSLKPQEIADFSKTASGDNLLAIFKIIKRFYKPEVRGKEVDVTDYLVNHYKKILSMGTFEKNSVINQFTMNKTAYNLQNNSPYIPGSSLKGAMRTAYLNALAKVKRVSNFSGKADNLESILLERSEGKDKMSSDPFRMVKVSDLLPVGNVSTKIVYAVNKKKKKSERDTLADRGGAYQIFETIQASSVFEGLINIDLPEKTSGIKNPIDTKTLLLSAHNFYADNLKKEITPLHDTLGIKLKADMESYAIFNGKFGNDAFLIRLGRHSGAEAVTIEGNRNIKIMQGRDKSPEYRDHATTLWLASDSPRPQNNNGLLPFGWAVLEITDGI